MALGDHLQRLVIDRLRGSGGGWDLNHSQGERPSHPQRQGNKRPCGVGCLPDGGKRLASRPELSVGVLTNGPVQPSTGRLDESGGQIQIAFVTGSCDPTIIWAFGRDLLLMKIAFYPIICTVFNEQLTTIGRSTNQQVL